jgi:hypothetical protein
VATRAEYRTALQAKLLGLEDEGYGDFEFADTELDIYLDLAVINLFPALYRRVVVTAQTPASYGTAGFRSIATQFADRVYLVEEAGEQVPISGWTSRGGAILGLDLEGTTGNVNLHYYDAFTLPSDDATDAEIANLWKPLIVLGALIEALESRHDTGVRGDPPPVGPHQEVSLIDRLNARYERLRGELAMTLPAVVF